jgi:carboxypeptidase C (cathepsin A)
MIEMSYFQVADEIAVNPHAWNRVANMLYLESPAGSGQNSGFSTCAKGGKVVDCSWDDRSQAEAYAHTLLAFFKAFPEFQSNDFYLAGESYFGQYGPNIAHFILNNEGFSSINLAGMLVGNGCWGGTATSVVCNGPNEQKNDVDIFYGKGLVSKKQYKAAYAACGYQSGSSTLANSESCRQAQAELREEVGPYNIYDVYDNCPATAEYLRRTGKDMHWLLQQARAALAPGAHGEIREGLLGASGGYDWECGGTYPPGKVAAFFGRKDVQEALHLGTPGQSGFSYKTSGPASVTLYPELAKKLRILIYNGDADMCVPYVGNEEWITDLEDQGVLKQSSPWRPWFTDDVRSTPAGAKTTYEVVGSTQVLTFQTIRLAGHMVPLFRSDAALAFFSDFVKDTRAATAMV